VTVEVKAIERVGDKIRLIDQTKLPLELVYHDIDDYHEVIDAMRRLEVRGAPAIGIAAAYGMAIGVKQTSRFDSEQIEKLAQEIKNARPTAVNLFWAVDRVVDKHREAQPASLEATLSVLWAEAEAIHEEDRVMCRKIGEHGAGLVNDGNGILTHCNAGALATGGIGTALGVMYVAHEQGKKMRIYADETRPLLQGARLTAWELQQAGIDVTLLTDNMAGMLMKQQQVDLVIVGADRIARNGDTANKIGTYSVAVLAKEHGVPFYVAAPMSTFDQNTETGEGIEIEQRDPIEVTDGFGRRTAPEGVKVYSPAFDVTPNGLVTGFITDEGIRSGGRK
jgi:methylthioribose-1-phosphate isomerase